MHGDNRKGPIIICGLPGSGIEEIAKAVRACGVAVEAGPGEGCRSLAAVNEDALLLQGGGWDCPPDTSSTEWLRSSAFYGLLQEAEALGREVVAAGNGAPPVWVEPSACLSAPLWRQALPGVRFIVCLRNPLANAKALAEQGDHSTAFGIASWRRYYQAVVQQTQADERLIVDYAALCAEAEKTVEALLGFMGRTVDMAGSLAKDIGRQNCETREQAADLKRAQCPEDIIRLYVDLLKEAGGDPVAEDLAVGDFEVVDGFFPDEGGWCWMSQQGVLRVKRSALPAEVGYQLDSAPAEYYSSLPFAVRLKVGGRALGELVFEHGNQTRDVRLRMESGTDDILLTMEAEQVFSPSDFGAPGDRRRLSVRMADFSVERLEIGSDGKACSKSRVSLRSLGDDRASAFAGKPNPRHLWEEDEAFEALFSELIGRSLVDKKRCWVLYKFAGHVAALPGDVAEVGVYKGGTARLLAKTMDLTARSLHLFDTFEGMPETDRERDLHSKGDFADLTLQDVQEYLADRQGIVFHPGFFPETAGPVADKRFCLAHIDVDIYRSVIDCCEFFYPRMTPGGVMLFDDYGFLSCPGALQAVDEFFADKPERPVYLPTGQALVVRHPEKQ